MRVENALTLLQVVLAALCAAVAAALLRPGGHWRRVAVFGAVAALAAWPAGAQLGWGSADEDLSIAYGALAIGLILAALTRWVTGPKFAPRLSSAAAQEPAPAP